MTLKAHFIKIFWEISMFCGALVLALTLYLQFGGIESVARVTLWQIILLVSTLVFRGESFINFHRLEIRDMSINYLVSSVLADVTLIILLYYFTPGGKFFEGSAGVMLGAYIIIRVLIYAMSYLYSFKSAREINAKLSKIKTIS